MNACSKISVWIGILFLSTFDVFAAYKISFINNTPYQVQATYYYSKIIKTASERKTISPHGSVQYEHGAWCGLGLSVTVNGPFGTINLSDRFNIACCNITWELNEIEKTDFATKLSLHRLKAALLKDHQVKSRPLKLLKATSPSLAMKSAHVVSSVKTQTEFNNPWVEDVLGSFVKIASEPVLIGANTNNLVSKHYQPTASMVNVQAIGQTLLGWTGLKRAEGYTHFQGIARWKNYLYVTGGNMIDSQAELFVIKMDSEPAQGAWSTNLSKNKPHRKDTVVKLIVLNHGKDYWHASGLGICGNYLAIPIEGEKRKTIFYKIEKDPANPVKLSHEIIGQAFSGGCSLVRLPNDHYLITGNPGSSVYYSKTDKLEDGFYDKPTITHLKWAHSKGNYQNVTFITQMDETLFIIATVNENCKSPIYKGRDYADLFIVQYDTDKLAAINAIIAKGEVPNDKTLISEAMNISRIANLYVDCKGPAFCEGSAEKCNRACSFNAAGVAYARDATHIDLYGIYHWTRNNNLYFGVFQS